MTPAFRVIADGEDVTLRIADRLVDLSVTDVAGGEADTVEMVIDDRDGRLALPPHQSELKVALGLRETGLVDLGSFLVDETELSGMPQQLRIRGTAADMSGPIRAPRTQAWEGRTLGDIARAIAGRAGLTALVAPALDGLILPFVAQTAESDLHLLTRLGGLHHFTFAPKAGRLILAERGSAALPTGAAGPSPVIDATELIDWSFTLADRGAYRSVEASWTRLGTAETVKIVVGDGEPRRVLRPVYASEDEARRAARASLQSAATGTRRGSVTLARFGAEIFAGGRVSFSGLRPEIAGPYTVKRADHRLGTTLTTRLELEAAAD